MILVLDFMTLHAYCLQIIPMYFYPILIHGTKRRIPKLQDNRVYVTIDIISSKKCMAQACCDDTFQAKRGVWSV